MNVGDEVQLKSGGPIMTIEKILGNIATCVWFDKNDLKRGAFQLETLKPYQEPPHKYH